MRHGKVLVLFAALTQCAFSQQASPGPLGVLIAPPHQVPIPKALRLVLPPNAVVRLVQSTTLAPNGEQVVVYEAGNEYEPHSHLAIVKNRRRVADFSLTKLFEKENVADTYALFSASQFRTHNSINAFLAAFRNRGNGAGTLFVLITNSNGGYRVAWQQKVTQGRLKVQQDGKIQLWNATSDENCVWCSHRYEMTTFQFSGGMAVCLS